MRGMGRHVVFAGYNLCFQLTAFCRAGTVFDGLGIMRKRCILREFSALALLLFAVSGAGEQAFPEFPLQSPNDYAVSSQQGAVTIGLDPVEAPQDQLTYFHVAMASKGFLPLFVVIHNGSKLDSLIIDKAAITYGTEPPKGGPAVDNTPGQRAAFFTTAAIPWIGPFIAGGLAQSQSAVKQNLVLRELQSGTVAPGETIHGFLYIAIPKKGMRTKVHIQFPIAWSGSDKQSTLNLTF